MRAATNRFLLWAPRVLALVVVAFTSLFALDEFQVGRSLAGSLSAVLIHLIPSFVLIAVVVLAWRRPLTGAVVFAATAAAYAGYVGTGHLDWIAVISGPLLLTALLFLANWLVGRTESVPAGG